MPAFNRFNSWTDTMVETANCGSDQFAIALTNVAPSASNTVLADITQISYTGFGSRNLVTTSSSQTAGNYSLVFANLTLGTTVTSPTFRYVVIYDDTLSGDPLVGWYDIGATTIPANTSLIFSGMGLDLNGASFNPLDLYVGGYTGGWYDPSDLATQFTLLTGYVSVAADADPCGYLLDKSQSLALGSELIANGSFSSGASWTTETGVSITGGALVFTAITTAASQGTAFQFPGVFANRRYQTQFDVSSYTSGGVVARLGAALSTERTAVGTYTQSFTCDGTSVRLQASGSTSTTASADNYSVKEVTGNHVYTAASGQRPQYKTTGGLKSLLHDGVDDNRISYSGGGSTTEFCYMSCVKPTQVGVRQTLFSDAGTNTGYKVEFNSSNQLVLSAGNGTTYTSVTTSNSFTNGQVVSIEAYDNGTILGVTLNNGTTATVPRPTVSAGTAAYTLCKDNGASSGYFKGDVYGEIYTRNKANTPVERSGAIGYLRAKGGL